MKPNLFLPLGLILVLLVLTTKAQTEKPIVTDQVVFDEKDGLAAIEAEFFYKQSKSEIRKWYITSSGNIPNTKPDLDPEHIAGASNNAHIEVLPDTRVTHADKLIKFGDPSLTAAQQKEINFSDMPGQVAVLHYKVNINKPGRYYVWVRAYSSGGEDNGIHVGLNGTWPDHGQRMQWCTGKNQWTWDSKQRTEAVHCGVAKEIYLDIDKVGVHDIQFSLREDGFEFDKFILTNDINYVPEGEGMAVKVKKGKLPAAFPKVK